MKYRQIILVSLFSVTLLFLGKSQNLERQSLERQRLEIIKRIEEADQELKKLADSKIKTTKELRALRSKINDREALIENIEEDLTMTADQLAVNQKTYRALTADIEMIKDRYYALLNVAYKQHISYNKWAFILNAQSINDSFQRWKYLKQFQAFCQDAYSKLQTSSEQVAISSAKLEESIAKQNQLLVDQTAQKENLAKEMQEMDALLTALESDETSLKTDLKEQKLERERLNESIETIIVAALSGKTTTTGVEKPANGFSFSSQKGVLSWPIDNGKIIADFGRQKHPDLPDVYMNNNGIDIQGRIGSVAQVIFEGEVVGVQDVPGYGKSVVVKHGDFYSVYAKLDRSYVEIGEEVSTGQRLGSVDVDQEGLSTLHFELWQGKTKLNPASWIRK